MIEDNGEVEVEQAVGAVSVTAEQVAALVTERSK
jgi:hypothetical protein